MVYFHGGGGVMSAPEELDFLLPRFAHESGANIIAAKYRLGPEAKAPLGIIDAYAITKNVVEDPTRFGCDPKKIGMFGESGGGYITAGVGMILAQKDESDLIRF